MFATAPSDSPETITMSAPCVLLITILAVTRVSTYPHLHPVNVLFLVDPTLTEAVAYTQELSAGWPGNARVTNCQNYSLAIPSNTRTYYDIAVHVTTGCPAAFTDTRIDMNVWDVGGGYALPYWSWDWDRVLVTTKIMQRDFCGHRQYLCTVVPPKVHTTCVPRIREAVNYGYSTIGVFSTPVAEREVLSILHGAYGAPILQEHYISLLDSNSSPYDHCELLWDNIDAGVVWHSEPSIILDEVLRYAPCTAPATLAYLNIPFVMHQGFDCLADFLDTDDMDLIAVDSYESLVLALDNLHNVTQGNEYWNVMRRIRYKTSISHAMRLYYRLFVSMLQKYRIPIR